MTRKSIICICLFLSAWLAACNFTPGASSDETPTAGQTSQSFESLRVFFFASQTFEIDESIDVLIGNNTSDPIHFEPGCSVTLLILNPDSGQWEPIENAVIYGKPYNSVLEGNPEDIFGTSVAPDIPFSYRLKGDPIRIRITVQGNIMRDGVITEDLASGSVEITLQP